MVHFDENNIPSAPPAQSVPSASASKTARTSFYVDKVMARVMEQYKR